MDKKVRLNKYIIVIIKDKAGNTTRRLAEHTGGTLAETKRAMLFNYGENAKDVTISIKYIKNLKDLLEPSKMNLPKLLHALKKFRVSKFENMKGKTRITVEIKK